MGILTIAFTLPIYGPRTTRAISSPSSQGVHRKQRHHSSPFARSHVKRIQTTFSWDATNRSLSLFPAKTAIQLTSQSAQRGRDGTKATSRRSVILLLDGQKKLARVGESLVAV